MYISRILVFTTLIGLFTSCIEFETAFPESTNESNFELLWKLVDERYCFMEYKEVNWDSIGAAYRYRVNNDLTEFQFFDICAEMLAELRDGHVNLSSDFNRSRYWDWFLDYPRNFNSYLLFENYLGRNYLIIDGLLAQRFDSVGYLRYSSFSDYLSLKNIQTALTTLGPIRGLIIDVRDNGGGYLSHAEEFASAFTDSPVLVGYIKYKNGPSHNDFTQPFRKELSGVDTVAFGGPIVVLTNRMVYSAANAFVSFMRVLPTVTVMGDVTGGGGGIPLTSELHNGWSVRFSTNPMLNANGEHIEFGVEPHIYVDMNRDEELAGIDTIIEEAMLFLSGNYYLKQ